MSLANELLRPSDDALPTRAPSWASAFDVPPSYARVFELTGDRAALSDNVIATAPVDIFSFGAKSLEHSEVTLKTSNPRDYFDVVLVYVESSTCAADDDKNDDVDERRNWQCHEWTPKAPFAVPQTATHRTYARQAVLIVPECQLLRQSGTRNAAGVSSLRLWCGLDVDTHAFRFGVGDDELPHEE